MESKLAELIKAGKENPFFILVVKGGPIEEIEDSIKSLSTDCYDAVEFRADFGNFIGSSVFHKMQIVSKLTFLKFLTDKAQQLYFLFRMLIRMAMRAPGLVCQ